MSQVQPVRQVAVVVPAHDEEKLLPACLGSIAVAALGCRVPVAVFVVADGCTDSTAALARRWRNPSVTVLEVDHHNVGAARHAGSYAALAWLDPASVLLLCTDADSIVPPHWIHRHLRHIAAGADLVVGTVAPSGWEGWPRRVAEDYRRLYRQKCRDGSHQHVHGANLSITGSAYLAVDGFAALTSGEDARLVEAADRVGRCVVFATDLAVRTSTRPDGRAPDGFSAHLRNLAQIERTG